MQKPFKRLLYFLFDISASLFALIFLPIFKLTRKYGVENFKIQSVLFKMFGVFPILNHYYEPKFVYPANFDATVNRSLPLEINLEEQITAMATLNAVLELTEMQVDKNQIGNTFYIDNPNFGPGDAELYYLLIREKKPKRIVEIGSGFSTQLALLAIEKNKVEGLACELTCIEPFEMPFLDRVEGIAIIRKQVELLSLDIFKSLEANDILFIDSSHIIRPGDDLLFIYFQILPVLKKGVLIHIHDIFTPRHYPQEWLMKKMRFWNEQYLLEAFLYNNAGFKILFTLNHLVKTNFIAANKTLIHLKPNSEPSSFWMEKV